VTFRKTLADEHAVAALATRLQSLSPDATRRWGKMNAHQMLLHLCDASDAVMRRRDWPKLRRKPSSLVKFIVLHVLRGIPRNVTTSSNPAGKSVDRANFSNDVQRAIAAMRELSNAAPETFAAAHPAFGKMTHREWLHWAYLHTDHHLRQFGA
jgi:hypothetical protein